MHPNVGVSLDLWQAGIKDLRNTRRNEMASMSDGASYGSKSHAQSGKEITLPLTVLNYLFSGPYPTFLNFL